MWEINTDLDTMEVAKGTMEMVKFVIKVGLKCEKSDTDLGTMEAV